MNSFEKQYKSSLSVYTKKQKQKTFFYVMTTMATPFPPGIHIQGNSNNSVGNAVSSINDIPSQQVNQPSSKKKYCTNCGDMSHTSKDCKDPIMSCGIILYRRLPTNELQYLMVCRRNTIGLVEIIRGRYEVSDLNYIRSLVNVMSQQEVNWVKTLTFDELWKIVWREHADNFNKEKKISEEKYIQVYSFIQDTLNALTVSYNDPEWGFPKGRRNYKESHRMAAIRELKEETSISPHNYVLHDNAMFEESYVSYDGKHYKNIYYIGCLRDFFDIEDIMRIHRIRTTSYEISEMKLLSLNDCLKHIRDYSTEKKSMLMEIDHYLHTTGYLPNILSNTNHTNSQQLYRQSQYPTYPVSYNNCPNGYVTNVYPKMNNRHYYGHPRNSGHNSQYNGNQSGYYTNTTHYVHQNGNQPPPHIPPPNQVYKKKSYPYTPQQQVKQTNTNPNSQYMSHLQ